MLSIGETARRTGLSVDTLRYYDKIDLLPRIARDPGGRRRYEPGDLSRLRFIQRAQRCNFSLDEIRQLLEFRGCRGAARPEVAQLKFPDDQPVLQSADAHLQSLANLGHMFRRMPEGGNDLRINAIHLSREYRLCLSPHNERQTDARPPETEKIKAKHRDPSPPSDRQAPSSSDPKPSDPA